MVIWGGEASVVGRCARRRRVAPGTHPGRLAPRRAPSFASVLFPTYVIVASTFFAQDRDYLAAASYGLCHACWLPKADDEPSGGPIIRSRLLDAPERAARAVSVLPRV